MSAIFYAYEIRPEIDDEDADWYETTAPEWNKNRGRGWPIYYDDDNGKGPQYEGPITIDLLRKLDAALGKPWGLS